MAYIIGDKDLNQLATKYALNEKYATESVKVLMQKLEDDLFALESSFTATAVGSASVALDDLSVRQAISYMDTNNFDLTECAFFLYPSVYWNQLSGLVKIAQNYSSNLNLIASGTIGPSGDIKAQRAGRLYGQDVFISPRVSNPSSVAQNIFLHPSAFGFAVQQKSRGPFGGSSNTGSAPAKVRVQMEYQLRNLGMLTVCDMIYGTGVLRSDAGITLLALSTATVA